MNNEFQVMSFNKASKDLNNATYTDYYARLMILARSVFKWTGLPNNIDEKWIERWLYTEGRCVFYKDSKLGFMVAKCTPNGQINYYDEPTKIRPYGTNYIGGSYIPDKDCVLIRNNDIMLPTSYTINLYAIRLTEISRTIDVNINAQKTPVLIKCSNKQKLSLKQAYEQWKGNEPLIFADKNMDTDSFEVLKTDAPIVFDKLQIQKHAIWNECMTFLGINNANMDKRERLVDDEVQANDEQIKLSVQAMLKSRERACEMINKIFDTNIKVELRVPNCEETQKTEDEDGVIDND